MFPSQEIHASISNTTAALIGLGTGALAASGTAYYCSKQLKEKNWQIQKQEALLKFNEYFDGMLCNGEGNNLKIMSVDQYIIDADPYYIHLFAFNETKNEQQEKTRVSFLYFVQVDEIGVGAGINCEDGTDILEFKVQFLNSIEESIDNLRKKYGLPK